MGKVKIYNSQPFYYILQGGNVAEFNIKERVVRRESTLHWLSHLNRVFIPEIPPGTEEYSRVLDEYKAVILRLPLLGNEV